MRYFVLERFACLLLLMFMVVNASWFVHELHIDLEHRRAQKAEAQQRVSSFSPRRWNMFADQAFANQLKGKYKIAIEQYTRAIDSDPEIAVIYRDRANCHWDEAQNLYELRAECHWELGQFKSAISDWEAAVHFGALRPWMLKRCAEAAECTRDWNGVISYSTELLDKHDWQKAAHRMRGHAYWEQGNLLNAASDLIEFIVTDTIYNVDWVNQFNFVVLGLVIATGGVGLFESLWHAANHTLRSTLRVSE